MGLKFDAGKVRQFILRIFESAWILSWETCTNLEDAPEGAHKLLEDCLPSP